MRTYGNRMIKINKKDLIIQIEENKKEHIEEYEKAIKAFKIESLKQLRTLIERVTDNKIDNISLKLTIPIDNSENYDKIMEMFLWEVNDMVELSQEEFKEYVQDETSTSLNAKFSNTMYL